MPTSRGDPKKNKDTPILDVMACPHSCSRGVPKSPPPCLPTAPARCTMAAMKKVMKVMKKSCRMSKRATKAYKNIQKASVYSKTKIKQKPPNKLGSVPLDVMACPHLGESE